MKLKELTKNVDTIEVAGSQDVNVADIAYHTRDVIRGGCFVAIAGNSVDGHNYIELALDKGASVVVSSKAVEVSEGVATVVVDDTREALASMSAAFFGEPSKSLRLIGITGTNGKTTITYLIESVWKVLGVNCGVIGTVNYRYGSVKTNPNHTTPESYELQKLFREMVDSGIDSVVMEVSSHSLDQKRVVGCQFDGAIFTNLTQDHLDYHLDMERYKAAKALLFNKYMGESSKEDLWAAINIDDGFGREVSKGISYKVYAYSLSKEVDVYAEGADYSLDSISLRLNVGGKPLDIKSSLIGRHNASNILGAVTACYAMGLPLDEIKKGIEDVKCVPGRLEPVKNSRGLNVFVDYAHTPDALKNVTVAIKELKPKRLITVFGCGGDRDKTKRPLMGYEAALRSDVLIVTSDNPRGEDPEKIINEIMTGVRKVGLDEIKNGDSGYRVEVNRGKAIKEALAIAGPKDVVLIAGKGHEDYQIIGKDKRHFDDREVVNSILSQRDL